MTALPLYSGQFIDTKMMDWYSHQEFVRLSNGVKVPLLGLGTSHNGGYSHSAVVYALKNCNYRLIDTAKRYGCEEFIGQAVKESGVPRNELFLTTKLWPSCYGYLSTIETFKGSIKRLGVDYLDLYLLHWPLCRSDIFCKNQVLEETWRAVEKLYEDGLIRAIGVSNYDIEDLEDMLDTCSIKPHLNQVQFHPYQNPLMLRNFCHDQNIQIEGYCPLAKGKILNEKPVMNIANEYNKTPAQILIKWSMQNNVITIPKSTKKERVYENRDVFDFQLSEKSMEILDNVEQNISAGNYDKISAQLSIDKNLPDGYKLPKKPNFRAHS